MSLFDKVLTHVKSVGYAIEGEEHKLLNEFVTYLGSIKAISAFSDSPVITKFMAEIAPQPASVVEEPAPVVEEPASVVEEPAPVVDQ